jgi:hypothetical protein
MRLYFAVAFLTFAGSFAVYSATQMSGAANAIGGTGSGTGYAALFRNFNPLTLLSRERVLAAANSGEGIPRIEPFRANFNASDTFRALQPPKITIDTRRAWGTSQYRQIMIPKIHTTPAHRPYR